MLKTLPISQTYIAQSRQKPRGNWIDAACVYARAKRRAPTEEGKNRNALFCNVPLSLFSGLRRANGQYTTGERRAARVIRIERRKVFFGPRRGGRRRRNAAAVAERATRSLSEGRKPAKKGQGAVKSTWFGGLTGAPAAATSRRRAYTCTGVFKL